MAVWINQELVDDVIMTIKADYGNKKRVSAYCRPRSWQQNRYIQITTPIKDVDVHYEYYNGLVQLHFEGKYTTDEFRPFVQYLYDQTKDLSELEWKNWQHRQKGRCVLTYHIETWDELYEAFNKIFSIFDPIIERYIAINEELFGKKKRQEVIADRSYEIVSEKESTEPIIGIKSVRDLAFDKFVIPEYQRPYKWTAKNVNQLISDLITFRNKKQYRLGTLVLHNNEIVDGQQRIITLVLLITQLLDTLKDEKVKSSYKGIESKVKSFSKHISFHNRYSLHNVVENVHIIERRKMDLDQEFLDFLLTKCEFVVVELKSISEAFQFFDSQNARGKDLEAHDLLKAYHLREIVSLSDVDTANIDEWQSIPTEFLKDVFVTIFRAKRWSKGLWARYFTKSYTGVFKGISLTDGKRYPFYQMEIMAHIFSSMYNNDPTRIIDGNHLDYPFNLDDQIINGSRFFDMIRHYMHLYQHIKDLKDILPEQSEAGEILRQIDDYDGASRTGDKYVKEMFYTLLLYYIDRFGEEELDKVIPQFFIWSYNIRLRLTAVQLATIDNYATESNSLFIQVYNAQTPYDIINLDIEGVTNKQCSGCEMIKEKFKEYNKYYGND